MKNIFLAWSRGLAVVVLSGALAMGGVSAAASQTLDRVLSNSVFKIGYRTDAFPFSYRDDDGQVSGYSIDLCKQVASDVRDHLKLADLPVDYVPVTTEDRFDAVATGKVDILCGASTATLKRREQVSFSIPIFRTGIGAVYKTGASEDIINALRGVPLPLTPGEDTPDISVGVHADTTAEDWLSESVQKLLGVDSVVSVANHANGLQRIQDGELVVYFADMAIVLGLINRSDELDSLAVAERFFSYEPYGLALARNDDDFRLLVDRTLSRLNRSFETKKLFSKYFGAPSESALRFMELDSLPE